MEIGRPGAAGGEAHNKKLPMIELRWDSTKSLPDRPSIGDATRESYDND